MEQVQKTARRDSEAEEVPEVEPKELHSDVDIDDLLDEIDGLLEPNAEEFVAGYVQRGGE